MLVAFSTDGARSLQSAPLVPATGDVDGDGSIDLVVGEGTIGNRVISDRLAVYRVTSSNPPELLDEVSAFGNDGSSASGNLVVADVDASVPGNEILVGEDGSARRAAMINVFGGLGDGGLRLLRSLRVVALRIAIHRPLQFIAGELSGESSGREIVVSQPNGYVSIHALTDAGSVRLQRFHPFADQDEVADTSLAIGDVLPNVPGNELIAGVPGKRDSGLVRVFDAMTGTQLAELSVFSPGTVHANVSLWAADVISALAGAELIVGKGADGGDIVVYSLASGTPRRLFSLPDALRRTSALTRFLTVGDLIPNMPGLEVAIAQPDAEVPVDVYHLTATGSDRLMTVKVSGLATVGAIAAPPRP